MLLPKTRKGYFPYVVGQIIKPTEENDDGNYYICTTAGFTALAEPTWPGAGTVNDGSVVWTYTGVLGDIIGARLLEFVNEAIHFIAMKADLPALEADDTVETVADTSYVALPDDFHRELFFCFNDTQGIEVELHSNLQFLRKKYHDGFDDEGAVYDAAIRGANLHYQYIPADDALETLTLHYFKKPTPITLLTATPDDLTGLDDKMADNLLIYYVSYKIFDLIERGADGAKVNRDNYLRHFNQGLADIRFQQQGHTLRVDGFRG